MIKNWIKPISWCFGQCHIVNCKIYWVGVNTKFTATQLIQNLQYDIHLKMYITGLNFIFQKYAQYLINWNYVHLKINAQKYFMAVQICNIQNSVFL